MIPQTIESEKIIKRFKALKKYFIIITNGPINSTNDAVNNETKQKLVTF